MAFPRVKQSFVELNDNKPQRERETAWRKKSKTFVPDILKILICLTPLISAELYNFIPVSKLVSFFFLISLLTRSESSRGVQADVCRLSQTAGASGKKNFRPTAARKTKGWWWRNRRWRGKQWEAILVVWKFLWLYVQSAFLSANRNISICFASQISQPLAFWPSVYLALIRCEIAAPCSQGQSFFSWSSSQTRWGSQEQDWQSLW